MSDELYDALKSADLSGQVGYTRYLCELYLQDHPDHVPTLLRYGNNLIALRQYSAARTALDRAQTLAPKERLHLVLAQQGHLLKAEGDFDGAEEMFMQAHKLDPEDATYLIYAGSVAFQRGDIDRALEYDRKAIECPEGCVEEAYFNLGGCLLSTQHYAAAADCYRKAIEIDPDYGVAKERLDDVELILKREGEG